ncbi:uncharacterized protein LOC108029760 [Drosophila biarmipes]|uniref:uncharacterized protein LOC108029760 n=1 Tax=Drosophila biarmipes TaxID=125945 RepID=UPI0007E737EF|nr:uncharacterized protein LOC108029760 [Drosophila biarmipes]
MAFVDKFLYCIDLKYGVLIIGFVDMILSMLCGMYLPWIPRKLDYDKNFLTLGPLTSKLGIDLSDTRFLGEKDFYYNRFGYAMYIFCLVVLVLHIGACILTIASTLSEEKWMSAPYIATGLMRFVILLLILIWIVAKSFDCTTSFWLIGLSLFSATYFWLTVVSWYSPPSAE